VEASRQGTLTKLWGQVRPHHGARPYRLQQFRGGRWDSIGGTRRTNPGGFLLRTVDAAAGARFRVWSTIDHTYGLDLVVQ
jgi:hypothetical protein